MKKFSLAVFLFAGFISSAQYLPNYDIEVRRSNDELILFPWSGGLNNPQFSAADFNHDGIQDLFIFDRTGEKVLTFVNNGTANVIDYVYAPEYEKNFPKLKNWALLQDYNCDGVADLWTYTNGPILDPQVGIQVYRGFYGGDNTLQFANTDSVLEYPSSSGNPINLYVSSVDIPSLVDVNGDGDIDVLTFQITGGYMMYFENISIESGFGCDSLHFKKEDDCWGDFFESGFRREDSLNIPCPFLKPEGEQVASIRHSGSASVSWDNDGDGLVELMTGDISFTNLVYLVNCGTPDDAHICSQDTFFPSYNSPADVFIFPAPFLVDVNNDGLKELLVAPNASGGSENFKCSWLYINQGDNITADFNFERDDFLVGDMIDRGEGNYPAFFDADLDGLKDMIVGNRGFFDADNFNLYIGQLAYYRNEGDAENPSFKLVNDDYAGISSLGVKSVCPTFGDLDGDGDDDMLTGQEDGTLLFFKNIAPLNDPADFIFFGANYGSIDIGNSSTPQLVDVDRDGLLDLLIGEQAGNMNYYHNTGTLSVPSFQLENDSLGKAIVTDPGFLVGFSAPYLFDNNDGNGYQLLVGSDRGTIFRYSNIDNNLSGVFTLEDDSFSDIDAGNRSTVSGADINSDGKTDLLIGNYRGGVTFYDSNLTATFPPPFTPLINIYPNPVSDEFIVSGLEMDTELVLMDFFGKVIEGQSSGKGDAVKFSVKALVPGIYFLQVRNNKYLSVKKIIVSR